MKQINSKKDKSVEVRKNIYLALELFVTSIIVCIYVYTRLYNLGVKYSYDYDEGVYLQTAKQMLNGYKLYEQVFLSQPPILIYLVSASMNFLGENLYAGRLPIALTSILTGVSLYLAARKICNPTAAIVGLAILTVDRVFLHYSRAVEGEVPCIAFAMLAYLFIVEYIRRDRFIYSFVSGLSSSFAILSKFLAAPILPAILPVFFTRVGSTGFRSDVGGSNRRLKGFIAFVIGASIPLALLLLYDPVDLYDQLYMYHRSKPIGGTAVEKLIQLYGYISENPAALILGSIGLIVAFISLDIGYLVASLSLLVSISMLVFLPQPLWYHHVAVLSPQLSLLSGLAIGYLTKIFMKLHTRLSKGKSRSRYTAIILLLFTALSTLSLYASSIALSAPYISNIVFKGGDELEYRIAGFIRNITSPDEWIISDDQAMIFVAGRNVPPELCDTSFMRISSGYLVDEEVIYLAEAYKVKIVVFWTGRLIQLKRFVEYIEANYQLVGVYDSGRRIYLRRD
ncbi:MAG: glycosyltransferase family 39 protein [Nitrososphaerota archaeon]|nr:glycosyltransferase family 39 protein [Candidatus Bathyarchaeota archaeon]MDW8061469.1 glycosyltransferase family 39 protein [Nitrososphaerota archaeon]